MSKDEIARLRTELNDKSNQIAELQIELHRLYGIEQRAQKAEAELEEARLRARAQ